MIGRSLLLAALVSLLVALVHGRLALATTSTGEIELLVSELPTHALRWPATVWLGAGVFGLLGSLALSRAARWGVFWRRFWLLLIAFCWLAAEYPAVANLLTSLDGFGPLALALLRPFALTTSVLLGYLFLLECLDRQGRPEAIPLALALPLVIAPLVPGNPGATGLEPLPLVAVSGLCPWGARPAGESADPESWLSAAALALQMLAKQCVAWGLILSVLAFLAEAWQGSLLYAFFVSFATGVTGWILSGLIWGLSLTPRQSRGRACILALARLLYGVRSNPAGSEQLPSQLETVGGGAGPEVDVGEPLDGDSGQA